MKITINPIIGTTLAIAAIFLVQLQTTSCTSKGDIHRINSYTSGGGSTGSNDTSMSNGGGSPKTFQPPVMIKAGTILSLEYSNPPCNTQGTIDSTEGSSPTQPCPKYIVRVIIPVDIPANTPLTIKFDSGSRNAVVTKELPHSDKKRP